MRGLAWTAARCLYGLMCGPVECLPETCISDLFFAHERGTYIAMYMFVLCGSNFIAPFLAGFLNDGAGWQWVQHWCAILLAANLVFCLFFYEDSRFNRGNIEVREPDGYRTEPKQTSSPLTVDHKVQESPAIGAAAPETGTAFELKSFRQKLKLWSYTGVSRVQYLQMMYRPVMIFFLFPNITQAGFAYGAALVWFNVYNATSSSILSSAPYTVRCAFCFPSKDKECFP